MRILIAHSFYRVGGGEDSYVSAQVQLLSPHHDVALLDAKNADLNDGVRTAIRMAWSARARRLVERRMIAFRPSVVHLHNAYPGFGPAVHLAAQRHEVPLIMTVHNLRLRCPNGLMFTRNLQCRRCEVGNYSHALLNGCFSRLRQATAYAGALWFHRFILSLEEMVSVFIAPSRFMRGKLRSWGIPEHRVVTIRNFVPSFAGGEDLGQAGLFLGRLSSEKGLLDLLEALRLAGNPPFKIVGEGPMAASLRQVSRQMGLTRTLFTGKLNHNGVQAALRAARFVVVPSLWEENAPLAAMEAMAVGRPLLVTSVGGLPELVDGGAGLMCEAGNASGLAAGIDRLMSEDDLCRAAGQRGREFAREHLHPDAHRQQLERAYVRATG